MTKIVYRGNDYRNPHKYHPTARKPHPLVVAGGLLALCGAGAIACILGSLAPAL